MSESESDIEYGDFNLVWDDLMEIDFLAEDDDDLNSVALEEPGASTVQNNTSYQQFLNNSAIQDLPPPETPSKPLSKKRFSTTTEDQINNLESLHQSESTKKNTKWGIKILQDWHNEVYGAPLDFTNISAEDLANKLRKFYCEVRPKDGKSTGPKADDVYHKNSLKNIRAAINRHLQDLGKHFDIVRDSIFKSANRVLDGILKERTRTGTSRPTNHKAIIEKSDMAKISEYFKLASSSAIVLRQCVWFQFSLHFVSRGLEFHHQLHTDSFNFNTDDDGNEYVTLTHETQQKNFQGGLYSKESPVDKRMYATGGENCPVTMLRTLLKRTHPDAKSLFNSCTKEALTMPSNTKIWFENQPLKKRTFCGFMADICKSAKCNRIYTPHCLRATAIQEMSDSGYSDRHIMFMSGHRNESSLRSYSRNPSTVQKKALSSTLSSLADGESKCVPTCDATAPVHVTATISNCESNAVANQPSLMLASQSNTLSSSGVLNNSSFNSCTFNIVMKQ